MKKNLKALFITLISLIIVTTIVFSVITHKADTVSAENDEFKPTIVIDAGHGGEDGGAVSGDNILEKNINLQISNKLKQLFISNGFDVVMTRETDIAIYDEDSTKSKKFSDLSNRVEIFNSSVNNVVISIHQNKFTDERYFGTQVFYSANNTLSEKLAECVRVSVTSLLQKDNSRQCKKAGSDIFVLDNAEVPAIMVECGFLSNKNETQKLIDDTYQNELTYCIFLGFLEFYNINY
ncbi:MAG: N-acetylmuramoyl-L-alanine amidase [Ruminococcus sp.]|nr:N-acetylmuramoyl-L-alanine amidase [Ruminococcus sp.]